MKKQHIISLSAADKNGRCLPFLVHLSLNLTESYLNNMTIPPLGRSHHSGVSRLYHSAPVWWWKPAPLWQCFSVWCLEKEFTKSSSAFRSQECPENFFLKISNNCFLSALNYATYFETKFQSKLRSVSSEFWFTIVKAITMSQFLLSMYALLQTKIWTCKNNTYIFEDRQDWIQDPFSSSFRQRMRGLYNLAEVWVFHL